MTSSKKAARVLATAHAKAKELWSACAAVLDAAYRDSAEFTQRRERLDLAVAQPRLTPTKEERRIVATLIAPRVVAFGGRVYASAHELALAAAEQLSQELDDAENLVGYLQSRWEGTLASGDGPPPALSAEQVACGSLSAIDRRSIMNALHEEYVDGTQKLPARLKLARARERAIQGPSTTEKNTASNRKRRHRERRDRQVNQNRRDQYAYRCHEHGDTFRQIRDKLALRKSFPQLRSIAGIIAAIKRYAKREGLPPPKRRKAYTRRGRKVHRGGKSNPPAKKSR